MSLHLQVQAMKHGVVVLSSVNGTFSAGETITGGTSGVTDVIQSDTVRFSWC